MIHDCKLGGKKETNNENNETYWVKIHIEYSNPMPLGFRLISENGLRFLSLKLVQQFRGNENRAVS